MRHEERKQPGKSKRRPPIRRHPQLIDYAGQIIDQFDLGRAITPKTVCPLPDAGRENLYIPHAKRCIRKSVVGYLRVVRKMLTVSLTPYATEVLERVGLDSRLTPQDLITKTCFVPDWGCCHRLARRRADHLRFARQRLRGFAFEQARLELELNKPETQTAAHQVVRRHRLLGKVEPADLINGAFLKLEGRTDRPVGSRRREQRRRYIRAVLKSVARDHLRRMSRDPGPLEDFAEPTMDDAQFDDSKRTAAEVIAELYRLVEGDPRATYVLDRRLGKVSKKEYQEATGVGPRSAERHHVEGLKILKPLLERLVGPASDFEVS